MIRFTDWKVAVSQMVGNALLLALVYYWLGLAESRAGTLAWSVVVACMIVIGACLLHGTTFAAFAGVDGLGRAFRAALRHLPLLFALALVVLSIYYGVAQLSEYGAAKAAASASGTKSASMLRVWAAVIWLLRWVLLPVVLIPLFAEFAIRGARGIRTLRRKRIYWLQAPLLLVGALWLPLRLVAWIPHLNTFGMEMTSFVVRLGIAYLLFIGAWMLLARVTASGAARQTAR